MKQTTSLIMMLGILTLFASSLLIMEAQHTGLVVCEGMDGLMTIQSGRGLSAHCINHPESGFEGHFGTHYDQDKRRYQIAQGYYDYGEPVVEQHHSRYFNNDVDQYLTQ